LPRVRTDLDPMRLFTIIVSAVFVVIGTMMISSSTPYGWWVTGFFAFCLLVGIFEPWLPKPYLDSEYRLVITNDEIACEHPRRKREAIAWQDVTRIWCVSTSDGPYVPDHWLLFEGDNAGCSVPTDAVGFDRVWDQLEQRFAGFDYEPLILTDGTYAKQLCWERENGR